MSFLPKNAGTGTDHSVLKRGIIANSATVAVGEAVGLNSTGYITNATAGEAMFGIVSGFSNKDGSPLSPSEYVAGTATQTDVQSVVADSDNVTVDKKEAIIETSEDKVWSVNVSGTLGTTADSPTATDGAIGGWIDTDSSGSNYARVLESTFTRTQTGDENFFVWGIDPDTTTRYLVSIANSVKKAGTH